MPVPRAPFAAALAAAAVVLSGCGETEEDAVRATVERFGAATAAKDYQRICDELIAKELSDNVEEFGLPCEVAFKQGLEEVQRPSLRIDDVDVLTGGRAKVRVRSTAANQPPSDDVLELRKVGSEWRVTSLSAPPRPARPQG